jgi:hypothetical protein
VLKRILRIRDPGSAIVIAVSGLIAVPVAGEKYGIPIPWFVATVALLN